MPNLLFCLTPGGSLSQWDKIGTLERELLLYRDYSRMGWKIRILSFGRESSFNFSLPEGIEVVNYPHVRLLPFLPFLRHDLGKWADVIKSNQSTGSWHFVKAANRWNKPIILRCGYVTGRNLELEMGRTAKVIRYQKKEASAFANATRVHVTTSLLSEWVQDHYHTDSAKISVLPNYVDTELFSPRILVKKLPNSVVSIGRLHPVKRFRMLIESCSQAGVQTLTIIGSGPERHLLEDMALRCNLNVVFTGQIANNQIPEIVGKHELYAQISQFEGHPKSLIEAMSCALPCLVTNTPGLSDQIEHNVTGLITESTIESITEGLTRIMNNSELATNMGSRAREHVINTMEFKKIRDIELSVLNKLVDEKKPTILSIL